MMNVDPDLPAAALFLDRDGTLIVDRGDLGEPSDVEFLPGVIATLQTLGRHFLLFIVTNQSAIARATLSAAQVERVNACVVETLARAGVAIARVFVCPHARTDGCDCIKPKPYFLHEAGREYGIDWSRSFTVGDHPHDVEFARTVGATGIYVLTGHGEKHRGELRCDCVVVPSLVEALPLLLTKVRGAGRT